jgi:hypothetical protein
MSRVVTGLWTAAGLALSLLVVLGVLGIVVVWMVGLREDDEDLLHHGAASLMFLACYLPWFVPHYVLRPSLTGLLVPFAGVAVAPFLFLLLLLFTMETPGLTAHLRTVVVATSALAPVAGLVWFVARCRRRWAHLATAADSFRGGRVAEVVAVVPWGRWTVARLVDVRTNEREEACLWGWFRVGEVCVVDVALNVIEREAPIVRGLGRGRAPTERPG